MLLDILPRLVEFGSRSQLQKFMILIMPSIAKFIINRDISQIPSIHIVGSFLINALPCNLFKDNLFHHFSDSTPDLTLLFTRSYIYQHFLSSSFFLDATISHIFDLNQISVYDKSPLPIVWNLKMSSLNYQFALTLQTFYIASLIRCSSSQQVILKMIQESI